MAQRRELPWYDPLHPCWVVVFAGLVLAWTAVWLLRPALLLPRPLARMAGYLALLGMLVPYAHVWRRFFRFRRGWPRGVWVRGLVAGILLAAIVVVMAYRGRMPGWGAWGLLLLASVALLCSVARSCGRKARASLTMSAWLRMHLVAAYLSFFFLLLHCTARTSGWFTRVLLGLFWLVMVSGAVGYYGQKLLYWLLLDVLGSEVGLERLEPERLRLLQLARDEGKAAGAQFAGQPFYSGLIEQHFQVPFAWGLRRSRLPPIPFPELRGAKEAAEDFKTVERLSRLEELLRERHQLDLEDWLHRLGRLWLLVHGPTAVLLLVLALDHALMSVWYGGF